MFLVVYIIFYTSELFRTVWNHVERDVDDNIYAGIPRPLLNLRYLISEPVFGSKQLLKFEVGQEAKSYEDKVYGS